MAQKYKSGDSGNFEMPLRSHKGLGLKSEKVSSWLIRKMESKKRFTEVAKLYSKYEFICEIYKSNFIIGMYV